jgi:hypothetical protein
MGLKEIEWEVVEWVQLAQDVIHCKHGNKLFGCIKGGEIIDELSDS